MHPAMEAAEEAGQHDDHIRRRLVKAETRVRELEQAICAHRRIKLDAWSDPADLGLWQHVQEED